MYSLAIDVASGYMDIKSLEPLELEELEELESSELPSEVATDVAWGMARAGVKRRRPAIALKRILEECIRGCRVDLGFETSAGRKVNNEI